MKECHGKPSIAALPVLLKFDVKEKQIGKKAALKMK